MILHLNLRVYEGKKTSRACILHKLHMVFDRDNKINNVSNWGVSDVSISLPHLVGISLIENPNKFNVKYCLNTSGSATPRVYSVNQEATKTFWFANGHRKKVSSESFLLKWRTLSYKVFVVGSPNLLTSMVMHSFFVENWAKSCMQHVMHLESHIFKLTHLKSWKKERDARTWKYSSPTNSISLLGVFLR